jgi:hypothetical protein
LIERKGKWLEVSKRLLFSTILQNRQKAWSGCDLLLASCMGWAVHVVDWASFGDGEIVVVFNEIVLMVGWSIGRLVVSCVCHSLSGSM